MGSCVSTTNTVRVQYQPLDINEFNIRISSELNNKLKGIQERLKEAGSLPKTKARSQEYCKIIRELKVLNHTYADDPSVKNVKKLLGEAYYKLGQLLLRHHNALQGAIDKFQKAQSLGNSDAEVALRFVNALLLPEKADHSEKKSPEYPRNLIFSNIFTPSVGTPQDNDEVNLAPSSHPTAAITSVQ